MNDGIELRWQARLEVMTQALRLRAIDDSNRALEPSSPQQLRGRILFAQIHPESWQPSGVEEFLVAAAQSRTDTFTLRGLAPVERRGHGAGISGEADEIRAWTKSLARELADVELAAFRHLGRARVAQVRIMGPNDYPPLLTQVLEQFQQRLEHVLITKVPGVRAPV